jgi:hypothetical protein
MNNIISQGRVVRLASRVKQTKTFLDFILKYQKHHGAEATVKWIKAGLVSIQKELGQDRLISLVPLGIPFNRSLLRSGLPSVIPASCRKLIRKGNVQEIRFWTGLFNIYRVLQIPGSLKLNTITDPYSGTLDFNEMISLPFVYHPFSLLNGFSDISNKSLAPTKVFLSGSASPSNKVSSEGFLSDLYLLKSLNPEMYSNIIRYLRVVFGESFSTAPFMIMFNHCITVIETFMSFKGQVVGTTSKGERIRGSLYPKLKTSVVRSYLSPFGLERGEGLSQFAIKEEAAGKIRLFALLDSVTQSALAPLHSVLFDLLRIIPNDGTFDQDASIRRSQAKSIASSCAYSFDLTAATDRLPAALTANILGTMFPVDISKQWLALMTDRNFYFSPAIAEKLKVSNGPYRYAVGQPMGGLSSWAGLAITHHWLVQWASHKAYPTKTDWEINYEILGDDLVIFDKLIADQYLIIMSELGCEINLNKSIVSPNRPVFEFAKRLCWGDQIVSGISMNQIMAGNSIGARLNNVLAFANAGLITSLNLLAVTLSKYLFKGKNSSAFNVFNKTSNNDKLITLSLLALLGSFVNNKQISLESMMTILQNPNKDSDGLIGKTSSLPIHASLKLAFQVLKETSASFDSPQLSQYFSKYDKRVEMYQAFHPQFISALCLALMEKGVILANIFSDKMRERAINLVPTFTVVNNEGLSLHECPVHELPPYIQALYMELERLGYDILNVHLYGKPLTDILDYLEYVRGLPTIDSWQSEVDEIENIYGTVPADLLPKKPDLPSLDLVLAIQAKLELLSFQINPPVVIKPGKFIMETAPSIALAKRAKRAQLNEIKLLIDIGKLSSRL